MNEKITRKSEHEIARLKIRIEEKDRYIDKLKKDFERVFEELKKLKKESERSNKYDTSGGGLGVSTKMMSLTQATSFGLQPPQSQSQIPYLPVDKNPFLLEEYQRKVRDQD